MKTRVHSFLLLNWVACIRRMCHVARVVRRVLPVLGCVLLVSLAALFVAPVRNLVLLFVIPPAWRPLPTPQLLKIMLDTRHVHNVAVYQDLSCEKLSEQLQLDGYGPAVDPEADRESRVKTNQDGSSVSDKFLKAREEDEELIARAHSWVSATSERREQYERYLPLMTAYDKARLLRTWRALDQACNLNNLSYFFVEGTLLGVYRHGGMIPWDDDIDIAMDARDWKKILRVLSCVPGYRLRVKDNLHWKFYPADANTLYYPFVDIFLLAHDDDYTWAVTPYVATSTAFCTDDIYPLTWMSFEGYLAPVPRNTRVVLETMYDVNMCHSPWHNHRLGRGYSGSQVSQVPCHELDGLYTMYHV